MELAVLLTVMAGIVLTAAGPFVNDTEEAVDLLMFQASVLGAVELLRGLGELYAGALPEAIIDFSSTFLLWTSGVAVTPAIISRGISRVGKDVEDPVIGNQKCLAAITILIITYLSATALTVNLGLLPEHLDVLPLYILIFSLSVFNMSVRSDPLKILIGLNMAENAFEPLIAELPLIQIALALAAAQFVNVTALFIITEGRKEFGDLRINRWRNPS